MPFMRAEPGSPNCLPASTNGSCITSACSVSRLICAMVIGNCPACLDQIFEPTYHRDRQVVWFIIQCLTQLPEITIEPLNHGTGEQPLSAIPVPEVAHRRIIIECFPDIARVEH